jgi:hypothetical protein
MAGENYRAPILTSWKEIASYLGKGVRTAQRWEQCMGLPVRRPEGAKNKNKVLAHTADLDAWLESRWERRPAYQKRDLPEGSALLPRVVSGQNLIQEIGRCRKLLGTSLELHEELRAAVQVLRREFEMFKQNNSDFRKYAYPVQSIHTFEYTNLSDLQSAPQSLSKTA